MSELISLPTQSDAGDFDGTVGKGLFAIKGNAQFGRVNIDLGGTDPTNIAVYVANEGEEKLFDIYVATATALRYHVISNLQVPLKGGEKIIVTTSGSVGPVVVDVMVEVA